MLSFTRGTAFNGRLCLFSVHHPWGRRNATKEATRIAPPTPRDADRDLGTVKQSSRTWVAVWAGEADFDPATARETIVEGQRPVLDRLRAEAADRRDEAVPLRASTSGNGANGPQPTAKTKKESTCPTGRRFFFVHRTTTIITKPPPGFE